MDNTKDVYKAIKITNVEYNDLLVKEARLLQLEVNGVNNWGYYGCMCQGNMEDECIFCTEDELKFLGLKD